SRVAGVVTELGGPQNFKVMTEGSSSMSAADRTAQEEFLRKVGRLYRALYGAQQTAENVQSRLKTIREALRETPAVEKQLDTLAEDLSKLEKDMEAAGAPWTPGRMPEWSEK